MKIYKDSETAQEPPHIPYIPKQDSKEQENSFQSLIINQMPKLLVDKTMLIKQVIEDENQIMIFHRPPKWGKSINLAMMEAFLGIQFSKQRQKQIKTLFMGGQIKNKKLDPLQIYKQNLDYFEKHFQKYVVVKIDLQFEDLKYHKGGFVPFEILKRIKNLYEKHQYLSKDPKYKQNLKRLQSICQLQFQEFIKTVQHDFSDQLQKFCQIIQNYFDQKDCYILIDNYSSAIQNLCFADSNLGQLQIAAPFISDMIYRCCTTSKTRRIIMMGNIDTFTNWEAHQIKAQKYDILDAKFSDFFGFTNDQMITLLEQHFSCFDKQKLMLNILEWYGGYLVVNDKLKYYYKKHHMYLFQPYCTLKYLQECKTNGKIVVPKIYYTNTSKDSQVLKYVLSKSRTELTSIIELIQMLSSNEQNKNIGKKIKKIAYAKATKGIFIKGYESQKINSNKQYQIVFKKHIAYLLISIGFLTARFFEASESINIYIPNKSYLSIFRNKIKKVLQTKKIVKSFQYVDLSNMERLKEQYIKAIEDWADKDTLNQATITALLYMKYALSQNPTHKVCIQQSTQNEEINGRIDIGYISLGFDKEDYVQQNKFLKEPTKDKLDKLQSEALMQSYVRGYLNWMIEKGKNRDDEKTMNGKRKSLIYSIFYIEGGMINARFSKHSYSLKQATIISKFFKQKQIQKIISQNKQKANPYLQIQKQMLKMANVEDLDQLLSQIKSLNSQKQIRDYLKNKNEPKMVYNQYNFNFSLLFAKYPVFYKLNLSKINLGNLFNFKVQDFSKHSKKKISKKQAELLIDQLKDLKNDKQFFIQQLSTPTKKPKPQKK